MISLLLLTACNEQNFKEQRLDALAVVLGDFDHMGDVLISMGIATTEYDGFIVQATYQPEEDRQKRGDAQLTVEGLLTSTDDAGRVEINLYQAAFINSGTRGLNSVQYNNPLNTDDSLILQPEVMDVACDYVETGNVLVVSDWAYDIVEYCWPDAMEFAGDDATPDAAQVGQAGTGILATVGGDDVYKEALGADVVSLNYDYSAWSVIESVGKNTEVLLSGDIFYQPTAADLPQLLPAAPLLVRFTAGKGTVVFSTFHWGAQSGGLPATLMEATVVGLNPSAEDTTSSGSAP